MGETSEVSRKTFIKNVLFSFQTSFLCLPNEVLTKIFEYLHTHDRSNLASLDGRLAEVEEKTGYRRFQDIAIISVW